MIILRDKITLLFQKWRYRCCLLHKMNQFSHFIYWQEFCSINVKHFSCGRKEIPFFTLFGSWIRTNTNTVLVQLLFFSLPLACVVDHDIARNEEVWCLISLGHLGVGRPRTACHALLSYSLHHCGTSVIYIYFIKDKKKMITLKSVALLKPVCDQRTKLLATCIQVRYVHTAQPGTAIG